MPLDGQGQVLNVSALHFTFISWKWYCCTFTDLHYLGVCYKCHQHLSKTQLCLDEVPQLISKGEKLKGFEKLSKGAIPHFLFFFRLVNENQILLSSVPRSPLAPGVPNFYGIASGN